MSRLAAMLIVLVFVSVACSPECSPSQEPVPAPTMAPTATPTPSPSPTPAVPVSPRLIVAMPPPTHQVRLPYMTFQSSSGPLHNLYDYLVGKDRRTGDVDNTHIAASWSVNPDAMTWIFELKEGIPYYRNGEASDRFLFSQEDVRHTWLLNAGINSERAKNSARWRPLLESADHILVDGNFLIWKLEVIQPDLHEYLSEEWNFGLISKEYWDHVGGEEGYAEHPIGMGAWSFVEHVDNEHFLLEKNNRHYRKEPEFEELQFLWVEEEATRVAMLLTNEIHIGRVPSGLFDAMESRGLKVARSTLPSYHLWGAVPWYMAESLDGSPTPNYDETVPTREILVRQALNLAIDRNYINDVFFNGDAIPSAVTHMAEWKDYFKDEWAPVPGPGGYTGAMGGWPYPYDLELARELLIEADYPNGFRLDFFAPTDLQYMPEIPDVGESIAEMWEEIGIVVNLTVSEYATIYEMVTDRAMNGKIFLVPWSPGLPSDEMGSLWRKATGPYYEYSFITEWKENYDTIVDPEERDRLAIDLGDFWYDNYLSIPLLWIFAKAVYNPEFLEGYEVNQAHFGPVRYHEYTVPIYR